MRDVIVCLPGITGSVLQKDGRDVWNISGGAVISALTTLGHSIGDLMLKDDPPDVDDLGDGITAPEVIRDIHLIPGIWKIDGYTKQMRTSRRSCRRSPRSDAEASARSAARTSPPDHGAARPRPARDR